MTVALGVLPITNYHPVPSYSSIYLLTYTLYLGAGHLYMRSKIYMYMLIGIVVLVMLHTVQE